MKDRELILGLPELDDAIGGIKPGELVLVAGNSGTGKTSLLYTLAQSIAWRQSRKVVFTSWENSPDKSRDILARVRTFQALLNRAIAMGHPNQSLVDYVDLSGLETVTKMQMMDEAIEYSSEGRFVDAFGAGTETLDEGDVVFVDPLHAMKIRRQKQVDHSMAINVGVLECLASIARQTATIIFVTMGLRGDRNDVPDFQTLYRSIWEQVSILIGLPRPLHDVSTKEEGERWHRILPYINVRGERPRKDIALQFMPKARLWRTARND